MEPSHNYCSFIKLYGCISKYFLNCHSCTCVLAADGRNAVAVSVSGNVVTQRPGRTWSTPEQTPNNFKCITETEVWIWTYQIHCERSAPLHVPNKFFLHSVLCSVELRSGAYAHISRTFMQFILLIKNLFVLGFVRFEDAVRLFEC